MYLLIHQKLVDNAGKDRCILLPNVFSILSKTYHVPRKYRYVILKELVNFKMVKAEGDGRIRVLKYNNHINNSSKIFKDLEMF